MKIANRIFPSVKPYGGFWASDVEAKRGWKDWCEDVSFRLERLGKSFKFHLIPDAKVLSIHSKDQIPFDFVFDAVDDFECPYELRDLFDWVYLDFELLVIDGYDAVELTISDDYDLYHLFYGWDYDSILIMNPDIVVPITE